MRVIVTGASGVLGSAIYAAFEEATTFTLLGLAHSRPTSRLVGVDLLNKSEVENTFKNFKPDWVIHCAAERRADIAEKDPVAARKLNTDVPEHLASLAKSLKFTLIYISTNYVFDGTSPPYTPASRTNPLQFYGQTKRDGELAILGVYGASVVVLRVPVLYGPAPKNTDSAVNYLLDFVQDQSGKTYKVDHWATRYPTNVLDIAKFLVRLSAFKQPIPPILHYSSAEPFTKYEMCLVFAKILGVKHDHIISQADTPTGEDLASRPRDAQLYTRETEELGIEGGLGCCGFEEWWTEYIQNSATS